TGPLVARDLGVGRARRRDHPAVRLDDRTQDARRHRRHRADPPGPDGDHARPHGPEGGAGIDVRRAVASLVVVALAAGAAGCGSKSPEDVAKSNGEKVGKAANQLTSANSVSDIESGITDLQSALNDVKSNVKDKSGQLQREVNQTKSSLTD